MTPFEVVEAVGKISLAAGLSRLGARFEALPLGSSMVGISVVIVVPDRDSTPAQAPTLDDLGMVVPAQPELAKAIRMPRTEDAALFHSPEKVWSYCRDLLTEMLKHERDESFLVDGQRVFDPHRQGSATNG